jgi:hypothetical protein
MKKVVVIAALALFGLSALGAQGAAPRRTNDAPGPRMELGSSVLREYQQLSGTLVLGVKLGPIFKVGTQEYDLMLPPQAASKLDVRNGQTLSLEGMAVTRKAADGTTSRRFIPFKASVNGQEITLREGRNNGPNAAPRGQATQQHGRGRSRGAAACEDPALGRNARPKDQRNRQ